ncbi:MAG: recombinase family protein [Eubacteriales bacterium]|nr:recombinase family protein [Eubacteriales bacterium]
MNKKRCYIYTRVSTAAQTEGYSLEAQQERLREYAEYKGLQIAEEYCDAGKSGKSIVGRPAFLQMLDDISSEKDHISFVLVFKLSRFGRNAADILKSLQLLEDYNVDLVCVEDAIDSSTQGGKLTLTILSAVAEIERENIQVQFHAGRMQKILEGGWPGGPIPYGYQKSEKTLVINHEEAKVVKLIFEKYLEEDMTINSVVRFLNDHEYTKDIKGYKRPFTFDSVSHMLSNPFYCGRLMFNRRVNQKKNDGTQKEILIVKSACEAIITESMWAQVEEKRKSRAGNNEKVDNPDRISILSGLVKCPVCGAGLVASKNKHVNKNKGGHYKTIHYYSCRNYRKSSGRICENKHTYNQKKLDEAVFEIMCHMDTMAEFQIEVEKLRSEKLSVDALKMQMKELRKKIHILEHRKYQLGQELDNLDILSEDYDISYEKVQGEIDHIYDELELSEDTLHSIKMKLSKAENGENSLSKIEELFHQFDKLYANMTCEERRQMYRLFINRIEVFPENQADGRVLKSISFKIPIDYAGAETQKSERVNPDLTDELEFVLDCSKLQPTVAEAKATYAQIRAYVLEADGLKVSSLYIAQIKRKYGIDVGEAYNKPSDSAKRVPKCTREKEQAIVKALIHFRMLDADTKIME